MAYPFDLQKPKTNIAVCSQLFIIKIKKTIRYITYFHKYYKKFTKKY